MQMTQFYPPAILHKEISNTYHFKLVHSILVKAEVPPVSPLCCVVSIFTFYVLMLKLYALRLTAHTL